MSLLTLSRVKKIFSLSSVPVVEDFNLEVQGGEFVSFLGPSGCGKTTTLRMIAGFEKPTGGNIHIEGEDITNLPPNRRDVGMVFQSYALFPNMTVAKNIGFGLTVRKTPGHEIEKRVGEMLTLIQMEKFRDRYPYQLSGGQQQRVALARALAIHPRVLLLDEPLSALDAKIRVELRQEIHSIQKRLGITTIYVTHDQEEALSLSDRVVVMSQGKVEQVGTPFEIYNFPNSEFVAEFVGQINLLPVQNIDFPNAQCSIGEQKVRFHVNGKNNISSNPRLAVRPEEIQFGHKDGQNNIIGMVENVQFLGSVIRMKLMVNGVHLSADVFNERNQILPKIGQEITVNFPVHACWLI